MRILATYKLQGNCHISGTPSILTEKYTLSSRGPDRYSLVNNLQFEFNARQNFWKYEESATEKGVNIFTFPSTSDFSSNSAVSSVCSKLHIRLCAAKRFEAVLHNTLLQMTQKAAWIVRCVLSQCLSTLRKPKVQTSCFGLPGGPFSIIFFLTIVGVILSCKNKIIPNEKTKADKVMEAAAENKASKRPHEDESQMEVDAVNGIEGKVKNKPHSKRVKNVQGNEVRKISVPAHRYTPLKENWMKIFTPVVEHLQLQIRFNLKTRNVELRTSPETPDIANLQKGADFVKAFIYGFEVEDALALLRLDDLFIETFEINDVKSLKGDHKSRAIGRLAGKGGRTKFTIENVTKTRIVLADAKIHILGSFQNIQLARRSICNLILGSPPSKVYGQLRSVASRIAESF
ncbi:RNA-binding protein pno1 [Phymastichus coffea]|uniref:RNA-binding protein pno1 n=1 Tax=Phymastichus coffea TaxID=108790 RepID=UPI00273C2C35|nr:RNA-binding protein pno1 [Phymastichus coffea]